MFSVTSSLALCPCGFVLEVVELFTANNTSESIYDQFQASGPRGIDKYNRAVR